jgi:hypothetical protein
MAPACNRAPADLASRTAPSAAGRESVPPHDDCGPEATKNLLLVFCEGRTLATGFGRRPAYEIAHLILVCGAHGLVQIVREPVSIVGEFGEGPLLASQFADRIRMMCDFVQFAEFGRSRA